MSVLPSELENEVETSAREVSIVRNVLSHDLEGCVRGIRGLASILVRKHGPAFEGEASDVLQMLGVEADRINVLLAGLSNWLEITQRPLVFTWQDTARMARETLSRLRAAHPDRPVEFRAEKLPPLWSDATVLVTIFRELFSNALKFSSMRPITIVSVSATEGAGETIVTVRDNGVGFEAGHVGQLFKLFRRAHRKSEFSGEGAGLAIVHEIMRRHGGRVSAEAQVDQGAAFHLAFPNPSTAEVESAPLAGL